MKHLQVGFDAGYSNLYVSLSNSSDTIVGDGGFAMQFSLAADFDSTLTGPALLLGGKLYLGIIEGELIPAFGLFAKFVFKVKRR